MNAKTSKKLSTTNTTRCLTPAQRREYEFFAKWDGKYMYDDYPLGAIQTPDGKILLDDGRNIDILDL